MYGQSQNPQQQQQQYNAVAPGGQQQQQQYGLPRQQPHVVMQAPGAQHVANAPQGYYQQPGVSSAYMQPMAGQQTGPGLQQQQQHSYHQAAPPMPQQQQQQPQMSYVGLPQQHIQKGPAHGAVGASSTFSQPSSGRSSQMDLGRPHSQMSQPVASPATPASEGVLTAIGASAANRSAAAPPLPQQQQQQQQLQQPISQQSKTSPASVSGQPASATSLLPSKQRLDTLAREIDPQTHLDDEVRSALCTLNEQFVDALVSRACQVAARRGSLVLEATDVQFVLEHEYNMWLGPMGADRHDELTRRANAIKAQPAATDAHKQRMAAVKREFKKQ